MMTKQDIQAFKARCDAIADIDLSAQCYRSPMFTRSGKAVSIHCAIEQCINDFNMCAENARDLNYRPRN